MSSSSRRSRSSPRHNINSKSNGMMGSKISDDEILQLVSKLHHLLPQIRRHSTSTPSNKASANKVLQETCNYIRSLHNEMDDLSARLSQLLSAVDHDSPQAAIIRTLI